ncbi:hypothetical protein BurMR1_3698 [Burkholderia sp. MR1]|nr:hypothetical protein BurMR1_3698 [Burkholderia sp. MR1]
MHLRIGGWTRIWMVISVFFFLVAAYSWRGDVRYVREKADKQYRSDIENVELCKDAAMKGLIKDDAFSKFMYGGCGSESAAQAQAKRDQAISTGEGEALSAGLHIFLWPSACLGALFAALGWIRSGFRRRAA